jgi:hypothetical protein
MPSRAACQTRLRINPQAAPKPNLLKQVQNPFLTCFSRFEALAAWELIPRREYKAKFISWQNPY